MSEEILSSLEEMANLVDADRAFVFLLDYEKEIAIPTYKWIRAKEDEFLSVFYPLPFSAATFLLESQLKGEETWFEDIAIEMPDGFLKEFIKKQGSVSALYFPIMDSDKCIGTCGFAWKAKKALYSREITVLKAFVRLLLNTFKHEEVVKELRKSEYLFTESQRVGRIGSYKLNFKDGVWEGSSILDEIFGIYPNDEKTIKVWLDVVHPDDREMMQNYLNKEVIQQQKSFDKEYRIIRKNDKELRWVHGLGELRITDTKSIMFGTITDITELKEMELQRREYETKLVEAQKMESLGILAGGVAHDMNNVLGAILALASANLKFLPRKSQAYGAMETICSAAERGGKTVKSLLNFAHKNSNGKKKANLNDLVEETATLLEHTTLSKIELKLNLDYELNHIKGDVSALTHAFMNICVNAVDAMEGEGVLTISTRNIGKDWVEVEFCDTGCGMSKEIMDKALIPFFTTKEVGKGTGLGLPLVYSTVKEHDGQFSIKSEVGKGTCITLLFPPYFDEEDLAKEEKVIDPNAPSLLVLLVDDDTLLLDSITTLLQIIEHRVIAVSSGEAAISKIKSGLKPDLMILDMNMPGIGGEGTLIQIKDMKLTFPIILSTGMADNKVQKFIEAFPQVTLLSKPFAMNDLQECINHIFSKK